MLTIRGFLIDGIALMGAVVSIMAGVGGYLSNLPDPPERIAVAAAAEWAEPETTGAITPKDAPAAVARSDGRRADDAVARSRPDDEVRAWVDPPRRSTRSRGE